MTLKEAASSLMMIMGTEQWNRIYHFITHKGTCIDVSWVISFGST